MSCQRDEIHRSSCKCGRNLRNINKKSVNFAVSYQVMMASHPSVYLSCAGALYLGSNQPPIPASNVVSSSCHIQIHRTKIRGNKEKTHPGYSKKEKERYAKKYQVRSKPGVSRLPWSVIHP